MAGFKDSHVLRYKFPAVAWALIIFVISSVPSSAMPKLSILAYDKAIHAIIFFIFGLLVYYALEPQHVVPTFYWQRSLVALVIVIAYGGLDEFHQHFVPGRTPDVYDALADAIGGVASAVAWFIYAQAKATKPGERPRL